MKGMLLIGAAFAAACIALSAHASAPPIGPAAGPLAMTWVNEERTLHGYQAGQNSTVDSVADLVDDL